MPKRIPEDTKQRAVRLVLDHVDEYPNLTVACQTVAGRLGFGAESLRRWVRQVQVDGGQRQGVTTSESERVRKFERENRESLLLPTEMTMLALHPDPPVISTCPISQDPLHRPLESAPSTRSTNSRRTASICQGRTPRCSYPTS